MTALLEFLHMGGYAAFVWPSFALVAVVLIGLLLVSLRDLRDQEAALRALQEDASRDDEEAEGEMGEGKR